MEPEGTGRRDRASVAEIRNPWESWGWAVGLETCDDLVETPRCSTYGYPCEPETTKFLHYFHD